MTDLLAADSFTVRGGKVRGLSLHLQRFHDACLQRGHPVSMAQLRDLVAGAEGSPRLELHTTGVTLRNRPARPESDIVTLAAAGVPDTRVHPQLKGPDLGWLAAVLAAAETDEVPLLDTEDQVVEACFSAPVRFTPGSVIDEVAWRAEFPRHPRQLESVTSQLVRRALLWLGIPVIETPPVTLSQLLAQPTWLLNATHVRRVDNPDGPEWPEELLEVQRAVVEWLDSQAEPLPRAVR